MCFSYLIDHNVFVLNICVGYPMTNFPNVITPGRAQLTRLEEQMALNGKRSSDLFSVKKNKIPPLHTLNRVGEVFPTSKVTGRLLLLHCVKKSTNGNKYWSMIGYC